LVAGDVIRKYKEEYSIHHADQGKRVGDIPANQDVLVSALSDIAVDGAKYILDGHFSLFDSLGAVHPVPISTFIAINPAVLFVVVDEPEEIRLRLLLRDEDVYCPKELGAMQDAEVEHAIEVAKHIGIQLYKVSTTSLSQITEVIAGLKG